MENPEKTILQIPMKWIILLLIMLGIFLISALFQMPRNFYENEMTRKLFHRKKRQEEKEDFLKVDDDL